MKSGISNAAIKMQKVYNCKTKGYITAEACICIPIFIFAILFFGSFIRLYIAREIMQHAMFESAARIVFYSEVLWETGIIDELSNIEEDIIQSANSSASKFLSNFPTAEYKDFSELYDIVSEIFYLATSEKVFNEVYEIIIKKQIIKSLENQYNQKTESILKKAGIYNGIEGLNFDGSYISVFDENKLKISLTYKYSTGVPIKGLDKIQVKQHLMCNLWMDGDASLFNLDSGYKKDREEDNIWLLSNFERGRKIRRIFGANLPIGYQGISKFNNGKATLIKSIDLTAPTYASRAETSKRIKTMIDELVDYKGNEKPWGSHKIIIREKDVAEKELLLVIPRDEIKYEIQKELEFLQQYAYFNNITLTIAKYGFKNKTETQKNEEVYK